MGAPAASVIILVDLCFDGRRTLVRSQDNPAHRVVALRQGFVLKVEKLPGNPGLCDVGAEHDLVDQLNAWWIG
jgi:hypothetical protein